MRNSMLHKKGVALLWSLIISSVLLVITGTMVSFMVKENRMSINIEDSSQAYAYARTGIDWALSKMETNSTYTVNGLVFDFNSANPGQEKVTITVDNNTPKLITSAGYYRGVKRVLEYEVTPSAWATIDPSGIPSNVPIGQNSESFELQFEMWSLINPADNFDFTHFSVGLTDSAGNNGIDFLSRYNTVVGDPNYQKHYAALQKKINSVTTTADTNFYMINEPVMVDDPDETDPYHFRVNIRYIKDSSISMKISRRVIDEVAQVANYDCVASAYLPATEGLGDLSYLKVASTSNIVTYTSTGVSGDGSYINIRESTRDEIAIDNIVINKPAPIANVYTLLTSSNPSHGGTVTKTPSRSVYYDGELVTLSANPGAGFEFTNWTGDCSGNTQSIDLTINGNKNCTANFQIIPPEIYFPTAINEILPGGVLWTGINNALTDNNSFAVLDLPSTGSNTTFMLSFPSLTSVQNFTMNVRSPASDSEILLTVSKCPDSSGNGCSTASINNVFRIYASGVFQKYSNVFTNSNQYQYLKVKITLNRGSGKRMEVDSFSVNN